MKIMFEQDSVSGGVISGILEHAWRHYVDKKPYRITIEDLRGIHKAFLDYKSESIFGKIPESVCISFKEKEKEKENQEYDKLTLSLLETAMGINKGIDAGELFNESGFILHDRARAAAFGRFQYIYRAKGERIYWFESGTIGVYNVYATIDESGFQCLSNDMSSINIFSNPPDGESECEWMDLGLSYDLNDFYTILTGLVNIKKQYIRDYPLEYLLDPPDVNTLSSFSITLRNDLWDIVIQLAKKAILPDNERYSEAFNFVIDLLDQLSINPMPRHIVNFYDSFFERINLNTKNYHDIIEALRRFNGNQEMEKESFQDSLLYVCQKLQDKYHYKKASENEKTSYIVDLLSERCKDLVIMDQSQRGESANGKSSGEVDIYVQDKCGKGYTIIEALILTSVNKNTISEHINRIWKYDKIGFQTNYILVYYNGPDFCEFSNKYIKYLEIVKLDQQVTGVTECDIEYSETLMAEMDYIRNGKLLKMIHICINMHMNDHKDNNNEKRL